MSENSSFGSAFIIPESVLNKIQEVDEKIKNIQTTAEKTATSVSTSFGNMATGVNPFLEALDKVVTKLGTINTSASNAGNGLANLGGGIGNVGNGASKAAQDVMDLVNRLSSIKGNGTSGIMQATAAFQRLQESMKGASGMNIAELKAEIGNIEKALNDTENQLTKGEQEAYVKRRAVLSDELADQQRTYNERVIAFQQALDRMTNAEASFNAKQRKVASERAELYRKQNYSANTSFQGSLNFADSANTYNRMATAVSYLNTAKKQLSITDQDYEAKVSQLDQKIHSLTLTMKQLSMTEEQRIAAQKAVNAEMEKETNRLLKEQAAEQKRIQSIRELRAEQAKANNYKQNTSFQGSLNFSASANTLARQAKAIEYLKEARMKLSTADADYKQKLEALNAEIRRHSQNLKEATDGAKNLKEQTSYLSGYMSRWAQRMAFAFSVGSIKGFIEQVADVRGQFELSERSLEAILQNRVKADEIFNKTVQLAVVSPFRIKDLVDYTRQLSAYRIESDKLYDTTKRLADVSAGLGVDMGRLILAYGQVKAAAYLRGSEVRQFTEAGINMYGELQQYFKEVKGEAYTTAQIVDMISEKKVTFEDVENIFQRMTDKGGTFYNMQEIQAETLSGKISNLADSFDVMLNDIGKANDGVIKGMVGWATSMLDNWQAIASVGKAILSMITAIWMRSALLKTSFAKAFILDAAMVGKWQAFLNVFKAMPTYISKAKTAIVAAGGAIKAALGGLAVFAAFQAAWSAGEAIYEYRKKVQEAKEETLKAKGAIGALAAEYDKLANAAIYSSKSLSAQDLEKNIESRRTSLQKLIDLAAKDGLVLKINVENIDEKQLNASFNKAKKEYTNFVESIEAIKVRYEKNKLWDTWVTDGLNDDAKDYEKAVVNALSQNGALERVVATINAGYKSAKKEAKAYFDEIRAGQKDGESNIEYMTRMYEAIKKINSLQGGSDYKMPLVFRNSQADFNDIISAMNDVSDKAKELQKEFDDVLGAEVKKYKNDPIKIQALIDRTAADNDWSQYERDLAYKHFGVNISIKRSQVEKEVSWVEDYITNFFAQKKFGINLVVKEIDDDKAFEEFLDKGDQAAKAAKAWKEVEKRLASVKKNADSIKVDDSIRKIFKPGEIGANQMYISVDKVKAKVAEYKKAAIEEAKNLGVDPFEKENKKTAKQQRDILQERINLLKDMNSKYNELLKTESAEQALVKTRSYFKEAAQNVGWDANDILPDDASVAKRVRQLATTANDVAKRGNYLRIAADIEWNISKEEYDKMKDGVSRSVEDAFSGLDLYKKLKDTGVSDAYIKAYFGDLASSFEEVQTKIDGAFNEYITKDYEEKYGKDYSKWGDAVLKRHNADMTNTASVLESRFKGSDILKEYQSQKQKLGEQIYKEQISLAQELIKAYKTQLTDQLQLDRWYIEERGKIMSNPNLDKDTKDEMVGNLTKQRDQKHDENEWKQFQGTDMYISIFEDLDHTSTRVLNAMKGKLESLRTSLKHLTPEQLKQVATQMEKIDEQIVARNPYANLGSSFTQYIKFAKERKKIEEDWLKSQEEENSLKVNSDTAKNDFENAKNAYDLAVAKYGVESKEAQQAKIILDKARDVRDAVLEQYVAQGKITAEYAAQIKNGEKLQKTLQDSLHTIGSDISSVASIATETVDMLNAWGANIELSEDAQSIISGVDKMGSSLASIDITRPFTAVTGVIGVVTGLGETIGGIFGWSSKDSKLQEQIEEHQKKIERLQRAYEELKEAMDDAWNLSAIGNYEEKAAENLQKQNEELQAMIQAERDKKDSDSDQIETWQNQIEDNNKKIKALKEELTESLGGLGSESNYKSAAQEFADAWVDAFNEGEDTLDALNDKFNDVINNMLKKQLMLRGAKKILEPLFTAIDQAVSKDSDGGYEVTRKELAELKDLGTTSTERLNEYYSSMAELLGMLPTGASSTLSDLQQGIQSVTESTASALESLLNSIRYFLSLQRQDVASILSILQIQSTSSTDASNPQLEELKTQTGYLKRIVGYWDSVLKSGHTKGSYGIKVFMD